MRDGDWMSRTHLHAYGKGFGGDIFYHLGEAVI